MDFDIAIVGAGVVGLAIAGRLAAREKNVLVLEKEAGPGRGISSRNSEVIHSGIYYPKDFLKTDLCVEGRRLLYEFCLANDIPHKKIGKLIVAINQDEIRSIEELHARGVENGIDDLRLVDRNELKKMEPHVEGLSALYSPSTGIVDTYSLIRRLELTGSGSGATIMYSSPLTKIEYLDKGFSCTFTGPDNKNYNFDTRILINAAGLDSDKIAGKAGCDYTIYPVKGEYFRIRPAKQNLVGGLVYPSPLAGLKGLGIHATKDLSGALRLGPNAFYVKEIDYDVDPSHRKEFMESVRTMLPFLEEKDLSPDMAGIRPKIQGPQDPPVDFVISHEYEKGLVGLVNLVGIESPGLTACLSIAQRVETMLQDLL